MNGVIRKAALLLGVVTAASVGCPTLSAQCANQACGGGCASADGTQGACASGVCSLDNSAGTGMTGNSKGWPWDRCWPMRYANLAHRSVNRSFTPQVQNGHVLDQTVYNHHFDCGTDRLNCMGMAHLQYLSRRRPEPDRTIYLATSLDLAYDAACPDRYCGARQELDTLRVAAVQKYLQGLNCGRCPDFQVLVHDPADVTLHTAPVLLSVQQMYLRFRGGRGVGAGAAGPTGSGTGTFSATSR